MSTTISGLGGKFYFSPSPTSYSKPKLHLLFKNEISLPTPKESKVLEHIANGDLNKKIANKLNIKEDSVKAIVPSVLRKLHIYNRTILAIANHISSLASILRSRSQCEASPSDGQQSL